MSSWLALQLQHPRSPTKRLGARSSHDSHQLAVGSIQVGYCASDIISMCGVGIVIYQLTYAKSVHRCPSQVPECCERLLFGNIYRSLPLREESQPVSGRL